uniref:Uncharacterized protein n=1 Tax=Triatoma infestans TaxID=30076 RepID=A0A170U4W7_TRIIF
MLITKVEFLLGINHPKRRIL